MGCMRHTMDHVAPVTEFVKCSRGWRWGSRFQKLRTRTSSRGCSSSSIKTALEYSWNFSGCETRKITDKYLRKIKIVIVLFFFLLSWGTNSYKLIIQQRFGSYRGFTTLKSSIFEILEKQSAFSLVDRCDRRSGSRPAEIETQLSD